MLRIIQTGNSLPMSFILDPSVEFQAGMIAELTVIGNQVMATVSNGTAPIGVIDDIRIKSFTAVAWNEVIIVPAVGVLNSSNQLVTPIDLKAELNHANVDSKSFVSSVPVALKPTNGVITFLAGTALNFDSRGTGNPDSIRTIVNYSYQIPNIPGDDSTIGSGRVTVWYDRMFCQVDQFETAQVYPVNSNLYVSEAGLLTTRRPSAIHPAVGITTSPPSSISSLLEFMWF